MARGVNTGNHEPSSSESARQAVPSLYDLCLGAPSMPRARTLLGSPALRIQSFARIYGQPGQRTYEVNGRRNVERDGPGVQAIHG